MRRFNPTRTRSDDVDYRTETLAAFARELCDHAGAVVPFSATVLELATVRAELKAVKTRRAAIYDQLVRRYRQGTLVTSDRAFELRSTTAVTSEPYWAVDAATARKHAPADYARARVITKRAAVSSPTVLVDRVAVRGLPAVPRGVDPLDVVVAAYRHERMKQRCADLAARERDAIAALESIAVEFGWDGLPLAFSDGWRIGLRVRQYSSDELERIAPAVFDRLAVERVSGGSTRVYVAGRDSGDELIELDEYVE